MFAPKHFSLKVGCEVMLLKTTSTDLVNEKRGGVLKLNENSVDVTFKNAPKKQ